MCQSRVCGHKVEGLDCGSDISEWLSLALGLPNLRLIRQSDSDSNKKGIVVMRTVIHVLIGFFFCRKQ